MTTSIRDQLHASGVADVIVVLTPSGTASEAAELAKNFTSSELSHAGALTATATGGSKKATQMLYYKNLGVAFGTVDRDGLASLQSDKKRVASVTGAPQLSLIRPRRVTAASLKRRVTWGIEQLGVPRLWKEGLRGKGVVIGHLDTGVDGSHPALKKAIAFFTEFDLLGREVKPAKKAHDTDEHGTHTAATIAGRPVRGQAVGVAPEAKLASAIVIEGGQVVARVLGGMDWAVGLGVRILSMSLGFRGYKEDFLPLTRILRQRGVLPVFAVGNEGPGTSRSPGNYSESLSVGAHDRNLAAADFSSSQLFQRAKDPLVPDLLGPGVGIISAKPGGGYQEMDGTSMATPHLAGLAALLFQARPQASVDQVEDAIFKSCAADGVPKERGNRGIPSATKALELLQAGA